VLIEPRSTVLQQAWGWSVAYGVFVVLCAATTLYVARRWAAPAISAAGTPNLAAAPMAPTRKPVLTDHLM